MGGSTINSQILGLISKMFLKTMCNLSINNPNTPNKGIPNPKTTPSRSQALSINSLLRKITSNLKFSLNLLQIRLGRQCLLLFPGSLQPKRRKRRHLERF